VAPTLGDRLSVARRSGFVGRTDEIARFTAWVTAEELSVAVVHVHGPAGVGKSTLLRQLADVCTAAGVPVALVDARELPPSPEAFAAGFTAAYEPLAAAKGRRVLMVDTYELLQPFDPMLRDQLLPGLAADTLVVLAGQNAPGPDWLADPGWSSLVDVMPLANLSDEDSDALLAQRQIPKEARDGAVQFTRGHPLALALVGEVLAQDGAFDPRGSPDVIATLVERFVRAVPSAPHRHALEACAQVRLLTEPLLARLVAATEPTEPTPPTEANDATVLFGWLRRLPFVDSGRAGLYLHELAKDAIATDLEWRDPSRFAELHAAARQYYLEQLAVSGPDEQAAVLMDLMFLHVELRAFLRPADVGAAAGGLSTRPATAADAPAILAIVERHEGPESAALAGHWLSVRPDAWQVIRDGSEVAGLLCLLPVAVDDPTQDHGDPALAGARRQLHHHPPLRPGERVTHIRFWMARDTYQDISPVQSLIAVELGRHYLSTPGPALTLLPFADPGAWADFATYADQSPMPDADFTVGGHRYGVHGHDWRLVTPTQWLSALAMREVGSHPEVRPTGADPGLLVLDRDTFATATRLALRHLTRADRLRDNPLLGARVVTERLADTTGPPDRVMALQQVVGAAVEQLHTSPAQADRRLHRVLYRSYVQPAATLEKAAEALGLPSSTFRRHLTAAVSRVTDILWDQELRR